MLYNHTENVSSFEILCRIFTVIGRDATVNTIKNLLLKYMFNIIIM